MHYIMEYEICALAFLVIITTRFFCMRKFHNRSNRMFSAILCLTIVDIILDLAGSYIISHPSDVPLWLNNTVNTMYYIIQVALPAVMLWYVIILSGCEISKKIYSTLLPAVVVEIVLLTNSFTKAVFVIVDSVKGPAINHGLLFPVLYIQSAFYMVATIFTVLKLHRSFRKYEIRTIIAFVLIIAVAVVCQMLYPRVLITGVAMTIAIFMMYLTMQNPETMLDSITGTFNYSALIEYLRGKISEGKDMWITAVDVGGIRRINSIMGIRVGNELLDKVGVYINSICSSNAKAFRMIGTRFIIISDYESTHRGIVAKTTERFSAPWEYEGTNVMLLATIRYCDRQSRFVSPDDVINLIDLAYSKAAAEGFGTTMAVDADQLEQFSRKAQVKEAIRRAISSGKGFYLNYQPLYSVSNKKFCSAEALLRLNDPVLGQISPAEFIPVAEGTDLMYQIDSMVVKMACNFLKDNPVLFDSGFRLLQINLSATEFNNDTGKIFSDIASGIESIENKICFEVTETALTSRHDVLSDFMHRLIKRGVQFAIDDFGTGYANITQLAKLPFSIVKLDRTFISPKDDKEASILNDLVNMFDHIELSTVFEGVETDEQAEFAANLGVDQIQGFYYSHPISGDELVKFITEENKLHN